MGIPVKVLLIFSTLLGSCAVEGSVAPCKDPLLSKCLCGETTYVTKKQYVVNCTNQGFTNTKPLERLPEKTEVLIFTGNSIPELPVNVFGAQHNNSHLRVIDMSNNKIKVIHGKAFHKVSTVQRLILNYNELTADERHVRVFSNFENLLELHLTDAFVDNSTDLASHLHAVFLNSDLIKLRKLHLEQNEIRTFKDDPVVFCSLNDLMDLHLGDNKLEHIHLKLDCLEHLRFLDLEGNSFVYLTKDELSQLDIFPKRNQTFTVDLSNNPFSCGYQLIGDFYSWLNETQVAVRNKYKLKCKHEARNTDEPMMLSFAQQTCHLHSAKLGASTPAASSDGSVLFLSILLVLSIGLLIYTNMEAIKSKLLPIIHSLSKKVHYTTIGKNEVHEMEV